MLQRIQTVFLTLSGLVTGTVFFTPIYSRAIEDPQLWIGYGLAVILTISFLLSFFSIFKFSDRKNQMLWVKRSCFAQVIGFGFAVGILFSLGGIGTYLWDEALGTGLIALGFIFQLFALRSINKDEKLVRSMDRIR